MIQRINAGYNTYSYKNNNVLKSNAQNPVNNKQNVAFKGWFSDLFGPSERTLDNDLLPEIQEMMEYAYNSIKASGVKEIYGSYDGKDIKMDISKDAVRLFVRNTNNDPEFKQKYRNLDELYICVCAGMITGQNYMQSVVCEHEEPIDRFEEALCKYVPPVLYQNYML